MSGLIKGIGKAFKAVLKVAKVVVPIALAIGAVVFTGGAALGLTLPTWGAAVASVFGTTGLGAIAAGAVTWAGYGAVLGAATSAITGKNVIKGMQVGALTGAVSGGILGGVASGSANFAQQIDPIGSLATGGTMQGGSAAAAGSDAAATTTAPAAAAPSAAPASTVDNSMAGNFGQGVGARGMVATGDTAVKAATSSTGGFWSGAAGPIVGNAIAGLGGGLAAPDPQATIDAYGANYGKPAPTQVAQAPATAQASTAVANPGGRTGAQLSPTQKGSWKWDSADGEFVFVPAT